jgi:drug/metabolite transporter (DMT)-like permease
MNSHHTAQPFVGIALKVASTLFFTGMATLLKLVSDRYPVGELVFFRSAFALIPVFVWVGWRDHTLRAVIDVYKTERIASHLVRSGVGSMAMGLGFAALTLLPIADATAIGYAAPLLTVVFAAILLKEKVHLFRWTAVFLGLFGVLVMLTSFIGPETNGQSRNLIGALIALAAATMGALAATYTRTLTRHEAAATIVVYFSSLTAIIGLATIPLGWLWAGAMWAWPNAIDLVCLIMAGICGGIGQVFMTQSFRFGDASTIAPFDYTSMIWVLFVSVLVFGTWPSVTILIGTAIVIAAGLLVIWRERQLGIERNRSKRAQTPTTPLS